MKLLFVKSNTLNKAEKIARKGLLTEILVVWGILYIFLLLYLYTIASIMKINILKLICMVKIIPIFNIPISIISVLVIALLAIIPYWFLRKQDYLNHAYNKVTKEYSKKLAEKFLKPGLPVQVEFCNTRDHIYKDFFMEDLKDRVVYYAILGKKDSLISIYVIFKDEDFESTYLKLVTGTIGRSPLDIFTKEEFTTYCDIKDE